MDKAQHPGRIRGQKKKLLRSWDRTVIPYPFSKAAFVYGEPFRVGRDTNLEVARVNLEQAMKSLAERAELEALR